jgi:uncharacterized paraquat-inducible protein A
MNKIVKHQKESKHPLVCPDCEIILIVSEIDNKCVLQCPDCSYKCELHDFKEVNL